MPFPSIAAAARRAGATAARFPLALLSGAIAAVTMIAMVEGPARDWHPRVLATAALGISLFTAVATAAERRRLPGSRRWAAAGLLGVGLVLLGVWSQSWPDDQAGLRFAQLVLVAHLTVAVLAFARGETGNGFWQFNRFLLLRFLIAGVFAAALFVGLALAIAAIDQLFAADIPEKVYGHLFAVLALVFHPWFMLSGVPDDYEMLDALDEYPVVLKVFSQFVLLPLVSIYLLILTAYLAKVLVTRAWPSGWIGWLVSGVSAAGVLALLLLHPIRNRVDSRWVNGYGRWFFVALLPSLAMLLVAIGKRIGQYGVTEPRYFLLVLALWLAAVALYYGATGSRNIRPIPVTLALVALFTVAGPWGAYATSQRSQLARFAAILAANDMGRVGAATPARAPDAVTFEDRREMSAVLAYLRRVHGPAAVAAAVGVPDDSAGAWPPASTAAAGTAVEAVAMRRLNLEFVDRWAREDNRSFSLSAPDSVGIDIAGYDLLRRVSLRPDSRIELGVAGLTLAGEAGLRAVRVSRGGAPVATLDIAAAIAAADLAMDPGVDRRMTPLVVEAEAEGLGLRLVLQHASGGAGDDGQPALTGASGFLLIRLRPVAGAGAAPALPDSAAARRP